MCMRGHRARSSPLVCVPCPAPTPTRAAAMLPPPQVFDSARTRDLAVLCVRAFAGPDCPPHPSESDVDEGSPPGGDGCEPEAGGGGGWSSRSRADEEGGGPARSRAQASEAGASAGVTREPLPDGRAEASSGIEGVSWSDDDKAGKDSDGEEEECVAEAPRRASPALTLSLTRIACIRPAKPAAFRGGWRRRTGSGPTCTALPALLLLPNAAVPAGSSPS